MSLFHTHKWKTTGIDLMQWKYRWNSNPDEMNPYSLIHQVCSTCGDVQTIERDGHYTLQELTQQNN